MRVWRERKVARPVNHDLVINLNIFGCELPGMALTGVLMRVIYGDTRLGKRHTMKPQRQFVEYALKR